MLKSNHSQPPVQRSIPIAASRPIANFAVQFGWMCRLELMFGKQRRIIFKLTLFDREVRGDSIQL
jgi:hypothetical protein